MLALGLGANGVCPYVMVEVVCVDDYENDVANLCAALRKGIEKVISTIGIHEVRGYARQFSSIGVKPELAEIFQTQAFAASEKGGVGFAAARRRHRRAPADPRRRRGGEAREDVPLLPQGLQGGDRRRQRHGDLRGVLPEGPRARGAEPDLDAPHHGPRRSPIASRSTPSQVDAGVGHHDYPIVISSMSFGSQSEPAFRAYAEAAQGDQHPLHQRRGRGDPGHVRQVPQVARAAGRLGPLRGLGRDAQLLLRRRDQDRPGREARRGRPPARQEGLREGRRGAERHARHRPDLALQQPRPLLDRGPRRADRRAQDGEPRPARLGQGPGGPEHRHDRPRHRQGGRRHHHPVAASRAAPARRASTRCATSACRRTSAPAPCTAR